MEGTSASESDWVEPSNFAIETMFARGRDRGFVTYTELNSVLPPDKVSSEQIEDTLAMLSEMGIHVIEREKSEGGNAAADGAGAMEQKAGNLSDDDVDRTGGPSRIYLHEMRKSALLSREGEIALAKRIEAGRAKMIGAICETPLTLRAIRLTGSPLTPLGGSARRSVSLSPTRRAPCASRPTWSSGATGWHAQARR